MLPADHAPHPGAQTEWWHVHADLEDVATGEPAHVFAAFLVERTELDRVAGIPVRPFDDPVQAAWVRLEIGGKAWTGDRLDFPDVFAARLEPAGLRHGGWRIAWEGGALVLAVAAGPNRVRLRLVPTRAPVLPGEGGRVELREGSAHLWTQMERMEVSGSWVRGRRARHVEGTGFYKHQWGRLYDPGLDGFTWLSMDLDAELSLSIAWLEEDGVRGVPGSMAWISGPEGEVMPIPASELRVLPTRTWHSRRSRADWPVAWHVEGMGLDIDIEAMRDDQELWGFPAAMYLGPATATGSFLGVPVEAVAYVEQAGAQAPLLRFLYSSAAPR